MALQFWARGDNASANTELNATGDPAEQITFVDSNGTGGSPTGNLTLDQSSGAGTADNDTWVVIGGETYTFTIEYIGTVEAKNTLANVSGANLQGMEVVVITIGTATDGVDNYGFAGERIFFYTSNKAPTAGGGGGTTLVSETVMNTHPTGRIKMTSSTTNPPSVSVCFADGTMIAIPGGTARVETLKVGDLVRTADGSFRPILWHATSSYDFETLRDYPNLRPVRIHRGSFGDGLPFRDLVVSPQHRVAITDPANALAFGDSTVLVPAKHLPADMAMTEVPSGGIRYHHLLLDEHEMLISNGIASESFQPGEQMRAALSPRTLMEFLVRFNDAERARLMARPDAFYTLRHHEAALLQQRQARVA